MEPSACSCPHDAPALSAASVRDQDFTVTRLREGYDLAQVDAFLGRAESTLTLLTEQNAELRAQAAAQPATVVTQLTESPGLPEVAELTGLLQTVTGQLQALLDTRTGSDSGG